MVQCDKGCSLVAVVISPDVKLGLAGQTWCNVRAVDHASTIGPLHRQVYTITLLVVLLQLKVGHCINTIRRYYMYCKCIVSTLHKLYYLSNDVLHTYVLQCIRFTPVNMSGRSPPSPPPHRACVVMSFLVQSIVCELYECCKHEC